MNRDHSVIFEIASKYCISDSFVVRDGYSIYSEGFLPAVVDIMVIWVKFPIPAHFSSLIPRIFYNWQQMLSVVFLKWKILLFNFERMSTTYSQAWRAIVISNHSVREKQHCCVSPLCYYNTPYFCTPVTKCVGVSFTLSNSLILGRFQLGVLQFSSVLTPFSWDSIRSHKTVLISDALPKSRLSPVFLNNQYNHVLSCQVVICENKLLVQLVTQSHKCFSLGNHSALVCSSSVHFFFF